MKNREVSKKAFNIISEFMNKRFFPVTGSVITDEKIKIDEDVFTRIQNEFEKFLHEEN